MAQPSTAQPSPAQICLSHPFRASGPITTVPWPMFTRQLSFLKYQLCAEQPEAPRTLLGRWGWHWGDGARKGLVTRQRVGGSELCAWASSSTACPSSLRSKKRWGEKLLQQWGEMGSCLHPGMVTVMSVCYPEVEIQRDRVAPLLLRGRHVGAHDH